MKKVYITFIGLLIVAIGGGIFYLTVYKKMSTELPKGIVMQDVSGEELSFDALPKKMKLVEFIYTNCPDICPNTTLQMKYLRDELANAGVFDKDIVFLTITIDPEHDTEAKLQEYAKLFEMQKTTGWFLLRGNETDTKKLADSLEFLYRDPGDGKYIHTTNTYLLDENNRLIEVFGMGESGFKREDVLEKIKAAL